MDARARFTLFVPRPALLLAVTAAVCSLSSAARAQAYSYDPASCGAVYREEAAKPLQLRPVWEMTAAQECVTQSKFPIACRHYLNALAATDRLEAEGVNQDGFKSYLKTMIRTHGCKQ